MKPRTHNIITSNILKKIKDNRMIIENRGWRCRFNVSLVDTLDFGCCYGDTVGSTEVHGANNAGSTTQTMYQVAVSYVSTCRTVNGSVSEHAEMLRDP